MKRYLALFGALLFLGHPAAVPAAPANAQALLALHRQYVGWQFNDGSLHGLRMREVATKGTGVLARGSVERVGLIYRVDLHNVASDTSISRGFTGRIGWNADENGFVVPVLGEPAKALFARDLLFGEATTQLPATLHGNAVIDGKSYTIVRVTQADAYPIDLYIDPQTGAYRRAVIDPHGLYRQRIDILGYTNIGNGKKIISKWRFGGSDVTHTYTKVHVLGTIENQALEPPAQTAAWTFSNSAPGKVKLTQYRVIVKATVNGVPGRFILDTGASDIFFTAAFARKAKLTKIGTAHAMGITGSLRTQIMKAKTISFNGNTLRNVVVAAGGRAIDRAAPDGLLGFDFLAGTFATLNLQRGTLRLRNPQTVDRKKLGGIVVAADLRQDVPVVPMLVNGRLAVRSLLDSGSPSYVLISPDLKNTYGLRFLVDNSLIGYLSSHIAIGGVNGDYTIADCGHLDSVTLGPIVYQDPNTCETAGFTGRNVLIGLDFLRGFKRIDFDYQLSTIIFIPKRH
ncbi:MAG: aspartyl protease family protein [Vulcanimicrobiaceae bacterium]